MAETQNERKLTVGIYSRQIPYEEGYEIQKKLHQQVASGLLNDQLLLLEHSPVYTLGKRGSNSDFLISRDTIRAAGTDIVEIDRGGQITYHGPGQIVLYIISNLGDRARSIRKFIHQLEQVVIEYLDSQYTIEAHRNPDHPGVWVGDEKIAALGISIHNKTTMHGFALNISTDMEAFTRIIPCGIRDKGVCSVETLGRKAPPIHNEMMEIAQKFADIYGYGETEYLKL